MTVQLVPREYLQPNALARFRCIGGACEDSCCRDWNIVLDERSYKKLKSAMDHGQKDREEFGRAVKRTKGDGQRKDRYALIVLRDDRECPFHADDGNCKVQARFGEALLSDTCAMYPRELAYLSERVEMTGKLSCPELARQVLLHDDSMALVDFEPTKMPRTVIGRGFLQPDAYAAGIDPVRASFLQTLNVQAVSITARLAWLAMVAEASAPFFHRGCQDALGRLLPLLAEGENLGNLRRLEREFAQVEVPEVIGALIASHAIEARKKFKSERLDELLRELYEAAKLEDEGDLVARLRRRKALLPAPLHAAIDRVVTRYAMHFVFSHWHTEHQDLRAWVRSLYLRVALLRLVTLSHPRLGPASTVAELEQLAVLVAQRFSRAFEHNVPLLGDMERELEKSAPSAELILTLLKI